MAYIITNQQQELFEKIADKYDKTRGRIMIDYIQEGMKYMNETYGYIDYDNTLDKHDNFEVTKNLLKSYQK